MVKLDADDLELFRSVCEAAGILQRITEPCLAYHREHNGMAFERKDGKIVKIVPEEKE